MVLSEVETNEKQIVQKLDQEMKNNTTLPDELIILNSNDSVTRSAPSNFTTSLVDEQKTTILIPSIEDELLEKVGGTKSIYYNCTTSQTIVPPFNKIARILIDQTIFRVGF